jgi:DNA-binding transcriptional MerR regulator
MWFSWHTKTMELSQRFWIKMRIGELAKRSGLSRDTIRFYEKQGLIRSLPGRAVSNSYRDYPEEQLDQLEMIGQAQRAGFSLADVQKLMAFWEGQNPDFDGEQFLEDKAEEVRQTIADAQKFLEVLERAAAALRRAPRNN